MKQRLLAVVMCVVGLFGCTSSNTTTVGDGVFDSKEQAYFQVAVGIAMSSYPVAVAPMYLVSTALIDIVSADSVETDAALTAIITSELDKQNIKSDVKPYVIDLANLLKAEMLSALNSNAIVPSERLTIIKQMLVIIQNSAKARM